MDELKLEQLLTSNNLLNTKNMSFIFCFNNNNKTNMF